MTRVRIDRRTFDRDMARRTEPDRQARARRALTFTQRLARPHVKTGRYLRSLQVDGTRLFSDDPGADVIENGSEDTEPQAILRRAAQQTGAMVVDRG